MRNHEELKSIRSCNSVFNDKSLSGITIISSIDATKSLFNLLISYKVNESSFFREFSMFFKFKDSLFKLWYFFSINDTILSIWNWVSDDDDLSRFFTRIEFFESQDSFLEKGFKFKRNILESYVFTCTLNSNIRVVLWYILIKGCSEADYGLFIWADIMSDVKSNDHCWFI